MHFGPTIIVCVAFLGITIWSAIDAQRTVYTDKSEAVKQSTVETQSAIQTRLGTYENILRAGVGLFDGSDFVSRDEWAQFVGVFDLSNRYSGASAVGYVSMVKSDQLQDHVDTLRETGTPTYTVFPSGDRPIYGVVDYIAPSKNRNPKALGYDMYSDPTRHAAMDLARDTGKAAVTDPVTLVQDTSIKAQPGLLMYVPLYAKGTNPQTVEERRAEIIGFIYAPYRSYDLLSKISLNTDKNFAFQIWDDAGQSKATMLYQSPSYERINKTKGKSTLTSSFTINNQKWSMISIVDPHVIPTSELNRPVSILWGGALISVLMAAFIYLLLLTRTRSLSQGEEREVQAAKDELLALASHQLRTPATGVKQYIGMLREGYAGKLTNEQQLYLDKAYESNERQLGTINEMLSVARADAGDIELRPERFDITQLVDDVVEEQMSSIHARQQTIEVTIKKRPSYITADLRYIRMAVENLISNATKYTPEEGSIKLRLVSAKEHVRLVVEDTGVGVSPRDYPLLFQKFSRIPNELTNKVSGSGIGLYLTQKIVIAHGGTITFTSREGIGSTFTIVIPTSVAK